MISRMLRTTQGRVAVTASPGSGAPLVMIHGNSSCKDVFRHQFASEIARSYQLVAIDLPGHGESDNAADPAGYTLAGFAQTIREVLSTLKIERPAVLGWSLGGHIAMEMLASGVAMSGLMIVGAPPVAPGLLGMLRGFRSEFDLFLATKSVLTPREAARFAEACFGATPDPLFVKMIQRTDPLMRPAVSRCMIRGRAADERWIVEHTDTPIAVVNGADEPFARLDYVAGLNYANLWEDEAYIVQDAGHAPFFQQPAAFNALLERFLRHADAYRSATIKTAHSLRA